MPFYHGLEKSQLEEKVRQLYEIQASCLLCPRKCQTRRNVGERSTFCKAGLLPAVASFCDHHGEEPMLSGKKGAGTVFFAGCSLGCVYCQNYEISWQSDISPFEISIGELADKILGLQAKGCHNIEFVSPTHFLPQLVEALVIAIERGLSVPIVYNTSGYEEVPTLKVLEGIVDVYLPDTKYWDEGSGKKFSDAPDYSNVTKLALKEMWRQVGRLILDDNGVAQKGLVVRHLVLPNSIAGTSQWLRFIYEEISPKVFVSLMSQYLPMNKANGFPEISHSISSKEYDQAVDALENSGIEEYVMQELDSDKHYLPDFKSKGHPFNKA